MHLARHCPKFCLPNLLDNGPQRSVLPHVCAFVGGSGSRDVYLGCFRCQQSVGLGIPVLAQPRAESHGHTNAAWVSSWRRRRRWRQWGGSSFGFCSRLLAATMLMGSQCSAGWHRARHHDGWSHLRVNVLQSDEAGDQARHPTDLHDNRPTDTWTHPGNVTGTRFLRGKRQEARGKRGERIHAQAHG